MKYGIRVNHKSGKTSYCTSTRGSGSHLSHDDVIGSIALFEQEASAVKAVKQMRKAGVESANDVELSVIGVDFVVSAVIDVPHPPAKSGVLLKVTQEVQNCTIPKVTYYSGTLKGPSYFTVGDWNNIEAATYFKSEIDAQQIKFLTLSLLDDDIDKAKKELALGPGQSSYGKSYHAMNLQHAIDRRKAYEDAEFVFV